jgi:hypothetical protein
VDPVTVSWEAERRGMHIDAADLEGEWDCSPWTAPALCTGGACSLRLTAAVAVSLPAGVLVAHHADLLGTSSNLLAAFTPEATAQAARFGVAAWPALHAAGTSLFNTESAEWLAVLEAHGPDAEAGVAHGPLPDQVCERILTNSARYPLQWVLIAEASQSQMNTESPLLATASKWFVD